MDLVALGRVHTFVLLHCVALCRLPVKCLERVRVKANGHKKCKILLFFSEEINIAYSYEVHWEESNIKWASRWDTYLNMTDVQIHWFSIINSLVVVFFLAGKW